MRRKQKQDCYIGIGYTGIATSVQTGTCRVKIRGMMKGTVR